MHDHDGCHRFMSMQVPISASARHESTRHKRTRECGGRNGPPTTTPDPDRWNTPANQRQIGLSLQAGFSTPSECAELSLLPAPGSLAPRPHPEPVPSRVAVMGFEPCREILLFPRWRCSRTSQLPACGAGRAQKGALGVQHARQTRRGSSRLPPLPGSLRGEGLSLISALVSSRPPVWLTDGRQCRWDCHSQTRGLLRGLMSQTVTVPVE